MSERIPQAIVKAWLPQLEWHTVQQLTAYELGFASVWYEERSTTEKLIRQATDGISGSARMDLERGQRVATRIKEQWVEP